MIRVKSNITFILLAYFTAAIVSCKVSNKVVDQTTHEDLSTNGRASTESPKIIFLNYSIEKDTVQQEPRIQLINKIIAEGTIKKNTIMPKTPVIDDIEYLVLNNELQVLQRNYIANPLNKTIEYVTDAGQLAKKDIQLNYAVFSLRIQLVPTAKYISLKRYTGGNTDSIQLLITDILKN